MAQDFDLLLFGGSFDPPHLGHLALLQAAVRTIRPDLILIMPAYQAPGKGAPGAPARDRLRLAELGMRAPLAADWRRRCRVDASEARLKRPVYTIETLKRLMRERPGARLHFALGSDAAMSFSTWRDSAALGRLATWWAAERPGFTHPATGASISFRRIPGRFPRISSTDTRRALSLGEDCSSLLHKDVLRFIEKRELYGIGDLARLKAMLTPERFEHSLAVARWAGRLASAHGVDPERATRAGLLHDCGRSVPAARMGAYALKARLKAPRLRETAARHPLLLHAYISVKLARERFGEADPEILGAIAKHTLGAARMSLLEKLVYVADATSHDRAYPSVARLRALALRDLGAALKDCVGNKLRYARASGAWVHPETSALWKRLTA